MEETCVSYRTRYGSFYERQNSKDCLIHAINNAFGSKVLLKADVIEHIYETADNMHTKLCQANEVDGDEKVNDFLDSVMTNNTYFSSKVVFDAAKSKKIFKSYHRVPNFSYRTKDRALKLKLPAWTTHIPVVILGSAHSGSNHAIAVRDGLIYDSENKGDPVKYTPNALYDILKVVHNAIVFEMS